MIVSGYTQEEIQKQDEVLRELNKNSNVVYGYVNGKPTKVGVCL